MYWSFVLEANMHDCTHEFEETRIVSNAASVLSNSDWGGALGFGPNPAISDNNSFSPKALSCAVWEI